jgi:hypothetical protein
MVEREVDGDGADSEVCLAWYRFNASSQRAGLGSHMAWMRGGIGGGVSAEAMTIDMLLIRLENIDFAEVMMKR